MTSKGVKKSSQEAIWLVLSLAIFVLFISVVWQILSGGTVKGCSSYNTVPIEGAEDYKRANLSLCRSDEKCRPIVKILPTVHAVCTRCIHPPCDYICEENCSCDNVEGSCISDEDSSYYGLCKKEGTVPEYRICKQD